MRLTVNAVRAVRAAHLAQCFSLVVIALFLLPVIATRAQDPPSRPVSAIERADGNAPRTPSPAQRGLSRSSRQGVPPQDLGRAKAAARQQFIKSFGEIQASGRALLITAVWPPF